jgi:anti-sigma regulatory factor (Ser/Thr protein kinase)
VELRTELGLEPIEVSHARRLVADQLAKWRVDGGNAETTVLLVSELVTNALRYGQQPMRMIARRADGAVRVEIYDSRTGEAPRVAHADPEAVSGRGMVIVDALASRWGWSEFGGSKQVWFELDV